MKFEKAIEPKPNPCIHCPNPQKVAPMHMLIAVGFGSACVTKNGQLVWDEQRAHGNVEKMWTVKTAERHARKEPDADWRIQKHGPLHGETYQRQGENKWVCIEQNEGFA